jgi:heme exporter protein CcmD
MDLDFGTYGPFVIGAFAVTAIVFIWMIWGALSHTRRWKRRFEELGGR